MCKTKQQSNTTTENIFTQGLHHLGLTVPDVTETASFFISQLNFKIVGEQPDYPAIFVSDGDIMLTLWQAKDPGEVVTFSRHNNIGLHHFALKIKSQEALIKLHQQLQSLTEINFEFGPQALSDTNLIHMMCTIPGGIRVEFITTL